MLKYGCWCTGCPQCLVTLKCKFIKAVYNIYFIYTNLQYFIETIIQTINSNQHTERGIPNSADRLRMDFLGESLIDCTISWLLLFLITCRPVLFLSFMHPVVNNFFAHLVNVIFPGHGRWKRCIKSCLISVIDLPVTSLSWTHVDAMILCSMV